MKSKEAIEKRIAYLTELIDSTIGDYLKAAVDSFKEEKTILEWVLSDED